MASFGNLYKANAAQMRKKKYFEIRDLTLTYWPRGFSEKLRKLKFDLHFIL